MEACVELVLNYKQVLFKSQATRYTEKGCRASAPLPPHSGVSSHAAWLKVETQAKWEAEMWRPLTKPMLSHFGLYGSLFIIFLLKDSNMKNLLENV